MTNNKRFIVLLTAIMAVGLIGTAAFGANSADATVTSVTPVNAGSPVEVDVSWYNDTPASGDGADTIYLEYAGNVVTTSDSSYVTSTDGSATLWTGPLETASDDATVSVSFETLPATTTSATFTVNPGEADYFTVSYTGGDLTAGNSAELTVKAKDQYGNTVTSYEASGTLDIVSNEDGVVGSVPVDSADWVSGVATISTDSGSSGLTTAADSNGTEHSLTVSGTGLATADGEGVSITVFPAKGNLTIDAPDEAVKLGDTDVEVDVSLFDDYGNPITSVSSSVFYSNKDGDIPLTWATDLATDTLGEGTLTVTTAETGANLTTTGTHTLTLEFAESKSSASDTLTVNKKTAYVDVQDGQVGNVTDPVTVDATLGTNPTSSDITTGKTITLNPSWDSAVDVTDGGTNDEDSSEDGQVEYVFDNPGSTGTFDVDASFDGDNDYAADSDTGNVYVGVTPTNIVLEIASAGTAGESTVAQSFEVTVILEDGSGNPIENGNVDVTFDGTTKTAGPTDVDGKATVTFTAPTSTGDYDVTADFDSATIDATDYGATTETGTLTVTPGSVDSYTLSSVESHIWGESIDVVITPRDQYDNKLADSDTIDVTMWNNAYDGQLFDDNSLSVDSDGTATATITEDNTETPDPNYTIEVSVVGAGTKTFDIELKKRETRVVDVTITGDGDTTMAEGTTFGAKAKVEANDPTTTDWMLLTGDAVKVSFDFAGQGPVEGDAATTTYSPTATDDFTAPTTAGTYTLTADFASSDQYLAADQNTTDIKVEPGAIASISVSPEESTIASGDALAVNLTAYDSNGDLAASATLDDVEIVSEYDGTVFNSTAVGFDGSGQAQVTIPAGNITTVGSNHKLTVYSGSGAVSAVEFSVAVKKNVSLSVTDVTDPFSLAGDVNVDVNIEDASGNGLQKVVTAKLYREYDNTTGDKTEALFTTADRTTDSNGDATITLQAPEKVLYDVAEDVAEDRAVNYDVVAEFAGDSEYITEETGATSIDPVTATSSFDTTLLEGWNLMSVGFQPRTDINEGSAPNYVPDTDVGEVFGSRAGAVFYWNGTNYVGGSDANPVDPARGFWLYTTKEYTSASPFTFSDGTTNTEGRLVEGPIEFELVEAGWHMISSPFDVGWGQVIVNPDRENESVADADLAGIMSNKLWAYEDTNDDGKPDTYLDAIAPSGVIEADKGYWVKTEEAGVVLELPFSPEDPGTVTGASMAEMGFEPVAAGEEKPPAPPASPQAGGELKATAAVSSDGVTFEVSGADVQSVNVQVFNLNGAEIFSDSAAGNSLSWNANVANGVYLYGVSAKVGGEVKPLGIQKLLILQ